MPKLRLVDKQEKVLPVPVSSNVPEVVKEPPVTEPKWVTAEQLDNKIDGVVEKIVDKLEPASALTPEVRGMVKAVGEVQSLREALKDPTSAGIEEATSSLVTTVLGNALQNITGGGQQAVHVEPLKNKLAQIAINNLTGENSPLPQILDAATNILGKDKVRDGYDAGMHYIEQQKNKNDLPNIVLQFNENSQEDVVAYAQQQGYSDVQYAQTKLIEHKNRLYQEIEEYQRIQQGGQQNVTSEDSVVQEPVEQQEQYTEEQHVEEPYIEEPVIQQEVIEQHVEPVKQVVEQHIVEEPIRKANKVVVLHSKPRKLVLANDNNEDDNDYEVNVDKNFNVDVTYNKDNKNNSEDDELSNIDDIIDELGE